MRACSRARGWSIEDVSVVIPVFDGARFLAAAIDSALSQTLPPREVIVVDDGSSDATPAVIAGYGGRLVTVRQANAGTAAARNRGVALARCPLLAFLDADDLWLPDKLAAQVAALAADPDLEAVFGAIEQFHSPAPGAPPGVPLPSPERVENGVLTSALLIRREAFERVGPFDVARVAEWSDWYMRAGEAALRVRVLDQLVARRRLHAGNKGRVDPDARRDHLRALRARLARRRQRDPAGDS